MCTFGGSAGAHAEISGTAVLLCGVVKPQPYKHKTPCASANKLNVKHTLPVGDASNAGSLRYCCGQQGTQHLGSECATIGNGCKSTYRLLILPFCTVTRHEWSLYQRVLLGDFCRPIRSTARFVRGVVFYCDIFGRVRSVHNDLVGVDMPVR